MPNLRRHGPPPYHAVVIHGGPGAPGSVGAVARQLAAMGVSALEPLQTAGTLEGQVAELREALAAHAARPVTLIGWSWGAMLGFIVAGRHAEAVDKLIMVSSGGFEDRHGAQVMATRLSRLSADDKDTLAALQQVLDDPDVTDKSPALAQLGALFKTRSDSYDLITSDPDPDALPVQYAVHQRVWADAEALRASGGLLRAALRIRCPVVALHGDYDPHPVEGVRLPLKPLLPDFRLILLARCGHYPWLERYARDLFFDHLRDELL